MITAYKLVFDLSVYYAISGYYLMLFTGKEAPFLGFALLAASLILYLLVSKQWLDGRWKASIFLLPALTLLATQELLFLIHLLPAWIYVFYCTVTEKADTDYIAFRKQFGRSILLLLLLILPLFYDPMAMQALSASAVYILIQLVVATACIRCLREKKEDLRQLIMLLVGTLLCGILTWLGVPQFIMGCINDYVLQVLVNGLMLLGALLAFLVFSFFDWLMSINGPPKGSAGIGIGAESVAQFMGVDPSELANADQDLLWLNIIGYIVGALVILIVLFIMIRKLVKSTKSRRMAQKHDGWSVERHRIRSDIGTRRFSQRKPQDPRKAIRYYYGLYLHECAKRGVQIPRGWTCRDIGQACKEVFQEKDVQELEDQYQAARYCMREPISAKDAKNIAKIWRSLRKTK